MEQMNSELAGLSFRAKLEILHIRFVDEKYGYEGMVLMVADGYSPGYSSVPRKTPPHGPD